MIFDIHTHVFTDSLAKKVIERLQSLGGVKAIHNATLSGLEENMRRNSIDYSLVLPVMTNPHHFEHLNESSIKINNEASISHIYSFGGIHPLNDNIYERLLFLKNAGIKGIKIHPNYQDFPLDSPEYVNIIDAAFSLGLVVVTHAGFDIGFPESDYSMPFRIVNLLSKIKNHGILVLAHMGGLKDITQYPEIINNPNVYFDTAFCLGKIIRHEKIMNLLDEKQFLALYNKIGSKRILFGSDSPWQNPLAVKDFLQSCHLDEKATNDILYQNAFAILNIE